MKTKQNIQWSNASSMQKRERHTYSCYIGNEYGLRYERGNIAKKEEFYAMNTFYKKKKTNMNGHEEDRMEIQENLKILY